MAGNRTFTMIKPDAVSAGHTGAILKMIEEAGFRVVAMKKHSLPGNVPDNFTPFTESDLFTTTFATTCRPVLLCR